MNYMITEFLIKIAQRAKPRVAMTESFSIVHFEILLVSILVA